MATILDISLLNNFNVIFPFLLVWTLVYGILGYTKSFGGNKGLHAMIALILAFMALYSPIAIRSISIMAPFFVILMVFLVFMALAVMTVGLQEGDISSFFKSPANAGLLWWVVAFALIIGFGSFFKAVADVGGVPGFSQGGEVVSTPGTGLSSSVQEEDFFRTLFHPKVLGLIFIMLVALFTVNRLASAS